jgi:outer membrane protein
VKKVLLVIFLISTTALFAQTQKIGYVNTQTIMEQYSGAIAAQSKVDGILSKLTAQRDSMAQSYQLALDNYQKQQGTMSDDMKAQTEQRIVKQQQDLQKFQQEKFSQPNGEIYVKNEQIMGPVRDKVKAAINEVAKQMGYSFIFDKSSEVVLLYADDAYDITLEVLLKLKKGK